MNYLVSLCHLHVKMKTHHILFWMAEKQDAHSFEFSLFSPELSDTIWKPKIHIPNFKSSRSKDVRHNFALGILNRSRVQFRFLCSVLFYQRATLWSTLWSRLWNSEPFKCCLWNTLALLGKLGQTELMSLLDRIEAFFFPFGHGYGTSGIEYNFLLALMDNAN